MYPTEFYYEETISVSGFQKEISSQFDIQRLLQHQSDIWIAPTAQVRKKKKDIVFQHILVQKIFYNYRQNLTQLIAQMIDDGFSVYYAHYSLPFKFKKNHVGNQLEEFFICSIKYEYILNQNVYCFVNKDILCDLMNVIPEYMYFERDPHYTYNQNNLYNYIFNDCLEISPETSSEINSKIETSSLKIEIIHRIETLSFENEIPDNFYYADLSNLFHIKLCNIHVNKKLCDFLKQFPIKDIHLSSCKIDTLDFLTDNIRYLKISGTLSAKQQISLLQRITQIKYLQLHLDKPNDRIIDNMESSYPNIVKLQTNLPLSLVISRFPNLIEYECTNESKNLSLEAGITPITNPRLKCIKEYNEDLVIDSEIDRNLFDLCLNFPHMPSDITISSYFLKQLIIPFPNANQVTIMIKEQDSFDHLHKIAMCFPNCKHLIVHSKSKNNVILENLPQQLLSLQCINFNIEKTFVDNFNSPSSLRKITFSGCCFEHNVLPSLFNSKVIWATELGLIDCTKYYHGNNSFTNFTIQEIYNIVNSLRNVTDLDLQNLFINISQNLLKIEPLTHIEHLKVSVSHINDKELSNLVMIMPSLTSLTLSGKKKSEFYYLPPNSLEELEALFLDEESSWTKQQIKVFKSSAPNVEKIEIGNYLHDDDDENEDEDEDDESLAPSSSTQYFIDPDTKCNPEKTFYTEHCFWKLSDNRKPIEASLYRINICDRVITSDTPVPINEAFSIISTQIDPVSLDEELIEIAVVKDATALITQFASHIHAGSVLVEGHYTIAYRDTWVSLPALNTQQNIIGYDFIDNNDDDDDDADENTENYIHFSFSQTDSLYYVKSSSLRKIVFYALIEPQHQLPHDLNPTILGSIVLLSSFQPSDLKPNEMLTSHDFYKFLIQNETGACRHRAVIFKIWMDRSHPTIPTRIVTNDVHAFVEIFYNQEWFRIDLGGYPAKINYLNEPLKPSSSNMLENQQLDEDCDETVYFKDSIYKYDFKKYHELKDLIRIDANKKILLNCDSQKDLIKLQYGLQMSLKEISIPYCYIHHPSQLDCQHATLAIGENNVGYFTAEPQSLLYQFLKAGHGLLIINYQNFSPEQLVQFNDILDDTRQIKGLDISSNISIIGIIQDYYNQKTGSDFHSRFDQIHYCYNLDNIECEFQFSEDQDMQIDELCIELYESDDWESILLGKWLPSEEGWIFHPGLLPQACANGATAIHIKNGPWHLQSFCHFWRQVNVDGYFLFANQKFMVDAIRFRKSQGYTLRDVPICNVQTKIHVLSSYTYGFFLQNFKVNKSSLVSLPGFIDQANEVLSVLITEPISQPTWARFIDQIHEKGLSLNIQVAPDVNCDFLDKSTPIHRLKLTNTTLIHTNDIDGYLSTLTDEVIIDISECKASDLISSIQIAFQNEGAPFTFSMQKGFIEKCLERGQSIVLKGTFEKHLVYGLLPFLLEDHANLSLVFENKEALDFFDTIEYQIDKKILLQEQLSLESIPAFINLDEPYVKCIARYKYWQRTGDLNTNNNWQGLSQLESEHKTPEEIGTQECMQSRRSIIDHVLMTQPYVFIAGLSGVGKTTFIQENLCQTEEKLFIGKEQITDWLSATATKNIFLFLDEANLDPTDWSIFEGLFLKKPAIFHDGSYAQLSEKHKVIFAGNPLSYGGERQLSSLFKKYGNSIVFRPLSKKFIADVVLKPIITSPWATSQIVYMYTELCKHSTLEVLITPREIKTLALFASIANKTLLRDTLFKTAQLLLENSLPKESMNFILETMELKRFNFIEDVTSLDNTHIWGESHSRALFMIKQFLNLHLYRTNNSLLLNYEQKYGGLSGVILEGEPGLGKTKLIEIMLKKNGITPIRIPASESLEKKRAMLYTAFNEGHVVWIDELNSGPLLEQELNAYLSGRNLKGELPSKPGFLLIATQNPCEMKGRRALSQALLRRVVMLQIQHYNINEMLQILDRMGMVKKEAESLVKDYQKHKTSSKLTFRDLLKTAKDIISKKPTESKKRSLNENSFFPRKRNSVVNDDQETAHDTAEMAVVL